MSAGAAVLVWLVLILMMGIEFAFGYVPALRATVPFIGIAMAALVALTFMRLASSRGLPPIFAMAAVFWICVMLGLGSMDPFTRHDIPVGNYRPNGAAPGAPAGDGQR
jgi:hypothetical protein